MSGTSAFEGICTADCMPARLATDRKNPARGATGFVMGCGGGMEYDDGIANTGSDNGCYHIN